MELAYRKRSSQTGPLRLSFRNSRLSTKRCSKRWAPPRFARCPKDKVRTQQILIGLMGTVVALNIAGHSNGQEFDPKDHAVIADALSRAEVVVIGTFQVRHSFPWFDGWHYSAALQVQTVLHGTVRVGESLQYHWLEPFVPACHACHRLSSWFDRLQGIWFLKRIGNEWALSGTKAVWGGGPLPLDARDAVQKVIDGRR
jgi:hypothetical protein